MTEKPALPVFAEVFSDVLRPAPQPAPPTTEEEAHTKLKRNLDLALERHGEILSQPITEETNARDKRLAADVGASTIKAALTTDKTALKARQDNILELVMLRVIFHRKRMGLEIEPKHVELLKNAPRAKIEAALGQGPGGPRQLAEYDDMMAGRPPKEKVEPVKEGGMSHAEIQEALDQAFGHKRL